MGMSFSYGAPADKGVTPAQIALAWILAQKRWPS